MREWNGAVTDRSPADVINKTPKAYLKPGDLNRIEENIAYLSERINAQSYDIRPIPPKNWVQDNVPETNDIKRICDSILAIAQAYYIPEGYVDLSSLRHKALHFSDVNDIERNLAGIHELLISGVVYGYLKSYTYGAIKTYTYKYLRTTETQSL